MLVRRHEGANVLERGRQHGDGRGVELGLVVDLASALGQQGEEDVGRDQRHKDGAGRQEDDEVSAGEEAAVGRELWDG